MAGKAGISHEQPSGARSTMEKLKSHLRLVPSKKNELSGLLGAGRRRRRRRWLAALLGPCSTTPQTAAVSHGWYSAEVRCRRHEHKLKLQGRR